MRIGIRVWNLEDTTRFIDLIVTYRWWVPGKDPWSVETKTEFLVAQAGEWFHLFCYGPERSAMFLEGYHPGSRNDAGEEKQILISLERLPHWPPSNFTVGDEGPASVSGVAPRSIDYIGTYDKVRWRIHRID
jgi:hypothetical protein